ncbi:MAG TPA: hypothetical protein PKW50_04325 [Syntrophomonas sp.]|nr:hypothetical protein [Syntrophomonas sp.]
MKVFEITWHDVEKEWIAAPSIIGAIKFYCSETSFDVSDFDDEDEIREVPKEEWETMKIKNTEYDPNDPDDKEEFTVAELMGPESCLLAGTMYN